MRIAVVGGGPGGLYFALLTKKARPDWDITVYEQNRADDTFGFGVVFSDETLDEFLHRDPESYERIRDAFAYWDDIIIRYKGEETRCGGNGFAGCSRIALLNILQARCREVGVDLRFETVVEDVDALAAGFDMVVAADGVNSRIRERFKDQFRPTTVFKANKFTWMGSTRPLDAFTYFFKETPHGVICAHTYQYEAGRSTWIFEMGPDVWAAHGFDGLDEAQSAERLEALFAEELDGHPLIINRSIWRNFPRIACERWSAGNIALLGDAKATAHYSIGSGTKLAMECAIALSDAALAHPDDVQAAFAAYDAARRTPVEVIQHNADVSMAWFEHMERNFDMKPAQFAMVVMCRAKSITWDNLILRDEAFVRRFEDEWYQTWFEESGLDYRDSRPTPMFTGLALRGLTLPNRVVVSPMAQYRARDGLPDDWHFVHYATRAMGGAGLVFTEMTCPSPDARITLGCPGLWNDAQEAAWARIVDFVHAESGAAICLQLGHAGRKGSTQLGWERIDHPITDEDANWPLWSASPIPYAEGVNACPAELDRAAMQAVVDDFVQATRRGDDAGFDMLELHCAHGYLLASFLSPLTNQRTDEYGGPVENRLRFPLEVFRAMRAAWPADKPMSVRLSACDWAPGGVSEDDVIAIAQAFADAGCDLIDVSAGQTVADQKPVYGRMFQVQFAEAVRNRTGLRTMAVGAITEPAQVNTIIACRRADLVAIARPHLADPYFTRRAEAWYGVQGRGWQKPYIPGFLQAHREAGREREKLLTLQRKAKPARHSHPG